MKSATCLAICQECSDFQKNGSCQCHINRAFSTEEWQGDNLVLPPFAPSWEYPEASTLEHRATSSKFEEMEKLPPESISRSVRILMQFERY